MGSAGRLAWAGQAILSEISSDCIQVSKRKSGPCHWRKGEGVDVGLDVRKAETHTALGVGSPAGLRAPGCGVSLSLPPLGGPTCIFK